MYTYSKFSEMPGFLGYQEVLAQNGVHMEDRVVSFTPTDYMKIEEEFSLFVMASKYRVRDLYPKDYDENVYGLKDPRLVNAQVVNCAAVFGFGEVAVFQSHWQWVVVDGHYFNDFNDSADCYWNTLDGFPANQFSEVLNAFNDDDLHDWVYSGINTTHRTDSVKWVLWMPADMIEFVNRWILEVE